MESIVSKLVSGLEPDQKKEVKGSYLAALAYRKRFQKIIEKEIDIELAKMEKDENYSKPNYAVEQAARIEKIKAYKKFLTYLK